MWFIKAPLAFVLILGILYVSVLNAGQKVNIFLTTPKTPTISGVELPVALLVSFGLGALVWFLISIFQVIAAKSEVAGLKRKTRELGRELTDLRNMPVRDLDPELLSAPSLEEETGEI